LFACVAATALAFGGMAGAADARGKHKQSQHLKAASFEGNCDFSGAVTFTPPMTTSPQPVAQHADASGTCSGTFVDGFGRTHDLSTAPARYSAASSGDAVSCAFGLASGSGTLSLAAGEIAFTMHEYRAGATPLIRLDGKSGGGAWMPVTPSQTSDPAAAVQACNGSGLERFDLDAHLQTDGAMRG
jgi:hypothetical protein